MNLQLLNTSLLVIILVLTTPQKTNAQEGNSNSEETNTLDKTLPTKPTEPTKSNTNKSSVKKKDGNENSYTPGLVKTVIGQTEISMTFSPSTAYSTTLLDLIRNAKEDIKICMYNMDSETFFKSLVEAAKRNVKIEVALHKDTRKTNIVREDYIRRLKEFATVYEIKTKSFEVVTELSTSTMQSNIAMHHKFLVIDNKIVWTGSGNISNRAASYNDEAAIIMNNSNIAKVYTDEFDRLVNNSQEGIDKKPLTTVVDLGDSKQIDILMLPAQESGEKYLLNLIDSAQKEIVLLMSELTSNPISKKLIEKHKQGVKIYILTNEDKAEFYASDIKRLGGRGIEIVYSKNDHTMHQRCMVIDSKKIMVSTANFSSRGLSANIENIVVLESEVLAQAIKEEFERCSNAVPYTQSKWKAKN